MMLNYEDMKFKHEDECRSKNSQNIEMRNVVVESGIGAVEYDCYCKECGCWLYSFAYGYYDMY